MSAKLALINVLFLCTGNSARSIIAEAILNRVGATRFRAYSAGSHPKGSPNPYALKLLRERGYDTTGLRSKSWTEFATSGAPNIDYVFTVCDDAAGETCPIWPGHPTSAHWGIADPAAAEGPPQNIAAAFEKAYGLLAERIAAFVALPLSALNSEAVKEKLHEIGRMHGATERAGV
jgi:arsenate reductase